MIKTIALRFGEHFSPECGTIEAHQQLINELGYVWYGKLGNPISKKVADEIINLEEPKLLLINSGKVDRHWAHISDIKRETPPLNAIPSYYRDKAEKIKIWFKVTSFETAQRDIMARCNVISSGSSLSEVSKKSMSPYFIIEYDDSEVEV